MPDEGTQRDELSSLAKEFTTSRLRETIAWCRELFGGNGIVMDYGVMKYFADAEAIYSCEGTRDEHPHCLPSDHRHGRVRLARPVECLALATASKPGMTELTHAPPPSSVRSAVRVRHNGSASGACERRSLVPSTSDDTADSLG